MFLYTPLFLYTTHSKPEASFLKLHGMHRDNHGLGIPAGLAGRVAGGAGAGLKFPPATNPHPQRGLENTHTGFFLSLSTINVSTQTTLLPPCPPPMDFSTIDSTSATHRLTDGWTFHRPHRSPWATAAVTGINFSLTHDQPILASGQMTHR